MKKMIFMALILSLCLSACGEDSESGQAPVLNNTESSASSQAPEADPFKEVNGLLDEGKTEEAYNLLLNMEKNDDVSAMLDRFTVVPCNINISYNDGSQESLEIIYNSFGERMKETVNGKIKVYNTYDTTGFLLTSSEARSDGTTLNSEYTFDSWGNLISIKESIGTEVNCNISYTYENSKLISETYNYADGLIIECKYTYDQQGRELSETTLYSNGKTESIQYSYDKSGNLVSEIYKDDTESKLEHSYDQSGRLLKTVCTEGEKQAYTKEYSYSSGKLAKIITTIGEDTATESYTYNESGLLVSETREGSDYSLDIQYSYDEKGNLSKRIRKNIAPTGDTETDIYEYSGYVYYFK